MAYIPDSTFPWTTSLYEEGESLTLVLYPATSSDWICISTPPSPCGSFLLGRCATYITPERTLMPKQSTSCIKVQHGVLVSLYWLRVIYRSRDLRHPSQVVTQRSWTLGFLYSLQVAPSLESLLSFWLGSGGLAESDKHFVLLEKSHSRTLLPSKFLCSQICDFFNLLSSLSPLSLQDGMFKLGGTGHTVLFTFRGDNMNSEEI